MQSIPSFLRDAAADPESGFAWSRCGRFITIKSGSAAWQNIKHVYGDKKTVWDALYLYGFRGKWGRYVYRANFTRDTPHLDANITPQAKIRELRFLRDLPTRTLNQVRILTSPAARQKG